MELSDLIGFGFSLSDNQDGLKCWRMGIIFCGQHPLLTRIQVSDPQPMGPLVYMYVHSLSRKLLQKFQFESLTFSQMTVREISHIDKYGKLTRKLAIGKVSLHHRQ